jgi:hypothetical protein
MLLSLVSNNSPARHQGTTSGLVIRWLLADAMRALHSGAAVFGDGLGPQVGAGLWSGPASIG